MPLQGLDHVNIIATDLDETVTFYEAVFGLRRQAMGEKAAWMLDEAGRALLHLVTFDAARHGDADRRGKITGSIDHVAFVCDDFAGMIARCEALGLDHRVNDRLFGNFRQIFLVDPNNVKLELNFSGD